MELQRALDVIMDHRLQAKADRNYGFSDPVPVFFDKMRALIPASRGNRLARYLAIRYTLSPIPVDECRGDYQGEDNGCEVKATLIDLDNKKANFVQIRPYEKFEFLLAGVFVAQTKRVFVFKLNRAQLEAELKLVGSTAHGKKNHELAIHFHWGENDSTYQRWMSNYLHEVI